MELSQEQKERIKQNRERALEIQRQKRQSLLCPTDAKTAITTKRSVETNDDDTNEANMKRRKDDLSIERTRNGTANQVLDGSYTAAIS